MTAAGAPLAVRITARDGRALAGLLVTADSPRGALVVNAATGLRREFYLRFAAYCAARGWHALVYDYRGMGASAGAGYAQETARMSDWGLLDMPAALDLLAARYPQLPLVTVGHSVGGQLVGCMPNEGRARAHVMIATSTGYWRRQRPGFRGVTLLFFAAYGPLMLRRHGYVPRGVVWRGAPLPREVFLQWRRWCLSPARFGSALDPAMSDAAYASVRGPLLVWSFTDDPISTPTAVEALLAAYSGARIERRSTHPRDAGVRAIGHRGFFDERHRESLWCAALDWIDARCAAA